MSSSTTQDAWKHLPPYREPDNDFKRKVKGSCHCGRVAYWLSREKPLVSKYCHCNDCKTIHGLCNMRFEWKRNHELTGKPQGAPFQWAAIFNKTDMAFEKGVENLRFYNSGLQKDGYHLPCKVACNYCGSLIMDEGRNMVLMFPTLLELSSEKLREDYDVQ